MIIKIIRGTRVVIASLVIAAIFATAFENSGWVVLAVALAFVLGISYYFRPHTTG